MEKINMIKQDLIDTMISNKSVRTSLMKESHWYFFHLYFAHYVKYQTAPFQKEIITLTEDDSIKKLFIVACRGSGKSTLITTSYAIWSILGRQQKKFVMILCHTKSQAKQHMMNLRRELESNSLLRSDLGPFQEDDDEWGSTSLVFSAHGARITVASSEQSIRGIRHNQHRPDTIICDDVEDIASAKTREGRDKTYQWLTGEVIPAGDRDTRLIVIGNLLHEDSLLMRLKQNIQDKKLEGIFKAYPLLDENENILWPGKYPDMNSIENERLSVGNENAWQREYLLKIIPADDAVIFREWIKYYDNMPPKEHLRSIRIGVDLAISEKETADYTAMVVGWEFKDPATGKTTIYIDSEVFNKRIDFPTTVEKCRELHHAYRRYVRPDFAIEDVAYQRSLPQTLARQGLSVRGVRVGSQDKRSRLVMTSHRIKNGEILFPRKGCELLISQMVNFGVEKHDDVSDSFTTMMIDFIDHPTRPSPSIRFIEIPRMSPNPGGWRPFNPYDLL